MTTKNSKTAASHGYTMQKAATALALVGGLQAHAAFGVPRNQWCWDDSFNNSNATSRIAGGYNEMGMRGGGIVGSPIQLINGLQLVLPSSNAALYFRIVQDFCDNGSYSPNSGVRVECHTELSDNERSNVYAQWENSDISMTLGHGSSTDALNLPIVEVKYPASHKRMLDYTMTDRGVKLILSGEDDQGRRLTASYSIPVTGENEHLACKDGEPTLNDYSAVFPARLRDLLIKNP
jgi:hypothetical protein